MKETNTVKTESNNRNKFVIRNLIYDQTEKDNNVVTINKVQGLLKDGLELQDITLKSVHRKETRGPHPGIVIVETNSYDDKSKIMKNKRKLKTVKKYENIYIDNDQSYETRNLQASFRTVLREMGKEKDYKIELLRLGVWNARGWSLKTNDNSQFRKLVLEYSNCDVFAVTETFLRRDENLEINGFKFYGNNRKNLNRNAIRGSGGVGLLVKLDLLDNFDCDILSSEYEGVLWIKLNSKVNDVCFCIAVCYLPPAESTRSLESDVFFQNLLKDIYTYQNMGKIMICGDFNSRVGYNLDYIEGVDLIKPRTVVDATENHQGDVFINFLCDVNFAMLNGRFNDSDFTCISGSGRSVVDYICVPYEDTESILDFKIMSMSDLIAEIGYVPEKNTRSFSFIL
ncbi:Hypothetical predicted protein [Mytilus galloprovincialis]|uniref:Endonuclease/exonuclease/phosphatase domain-containing protein n=1 Tax=Mytilus galloprovincialis TaxID=29158 RepID=A0A8B6F6W3_MYTGA|nr:Hypothetical predicted protein [Mytilus galloprovincialis]